MPEVHNNSGHSHKNSNNKKSFQTIGDIMTGYESKKTPKKE
jgi:hypothetical protein